MFNTNNLNISIRDWFQCIKSCYKQIILLCALISLVGFLFFTKNHIFFSAQTTFQAATSPLEAKKMDFISSTLSFLSGQQHNSIENPFIITKYNKILEDIVLSANLQAEILDDKPNVMKRILNNIHLETTFYTWKRPKELAHLISKNVYIPKTIFTGSPNFFSQCLCAEYHGETLKKLQITVLPSGDFIVFDTFSQSCLGRGSVKKNFFFSEGSFKIQVHSLPKKQKTFSLILIPLPQAIANLKENLKITKDPSSHTLFNIQYKHINRHQAKLVLEKTLLSFKKFREEEEQNKIFKEKQFFNNKELETYQLIQKELDRQKLFISQELSDTELEAFISCQTYLKNINLLKQEIREIDKNLHCANDLDFLKTPIENSFYSEKISSYLLAKEHLEFQENNYQHYLHALKQNAEQPLFQLLEYPEIYSYINKITNLDYDLFKKRNWSETDIFRLKNEIRQEQKFLEKKIEDLRDFSKIKLRVITEKITHLSNQAIRELINKQSFLKQELSANVSEMKKIVSNKLEQEVKDSQLTLLFKQLEFFEKAKQGALISHAMNYLASPLLPSITVPNIPEHPHLLVKTLYVFVTSFTLMIFYLLIQETLLSPSISKYNLSKNTKNYLGDFSLSLKSSLSLSQLQEPELFSLSHLLEALPNTPTIIEIGSSTFSPMIQPLATLLKKRNEKNILVIRIKNKISAQDLFEDHQWNIHSQEGIDYTELSKLALYKSTSQKLLHNYHYILLDYQINQPSDQLLFSLIHFDNVCIFHAANERLNFIFQLHPKTFFISGLEGKTYLSLPSILGNCLLEGSYKWTFIKNNYLLSKFIKKELFKSFARTFLSKGAKKEPL